MSTNYNSNKNNLFYGSSGGGSALEVLPAAAPPTDPPIHYAKDQTKAMEDTTRTFYQTDDTANKVLNSMQKQRGQIQGAHEDVHGMREAMERAKQELVVLQQKYRSRKQKLYFTIFLLGLTDFLLLVRMFQCHGSFFC
eukprot:CAMPEP_0168836728 /NCGR_PEP_ID=MMETSP0727-20121128/4761_1 /TAXON_ID=265536 /ORGANISM="Amphiprora sp., Strain CCMP467" /LENGTH=137 /DNA_ID=CAMNT_0008890129 /DNA_START=23 /DNA_END=435 /DNA_ORIENTATION=-